QIHQRDVRVMRAELLDRFTAVGPLGHDLHVGLAGDERVDAAPEQRMIVDDEDADGRGVGAHECSPVLRPANPTRLGNRRKRLPARCAEYAAAPGIVSSTSVPEPTSLHTSRCPPTISARSRMPGRPKCPAFCCAMTAGSMPFPLSRTRSVNRRSSYRISTSMQRACAWRNALR